MKITFVLPYAGLAGGIRVVAIYAERLRNRGHEVTVVSIPKRPFTLKEKVKALLKDKTWPSQKYGHSHFDGIKVEHQVLEKYRPITNDDVPDADVVIATWWETAEWVNKMSESKGKKVYFIQGKEADFPSLPSSRVKATYNFRFKKITISKDLKKWLLTQCCDDEITMIYNSVDTKQFFAEKRNKNLIQSVGMLYSISPIKGCDISLKAIGRVKEKFPSLKLVSFGHDPIAPGLPLPENSKYFQEPPQSKIREIYSCCDVWICGSRAEGFHLPPLEAMACRCPVVSTQVGGPSDIITDGINGYLAPVGDHKKLADSLLKVLILQEQEWLKMSENACQTAFSYTWDDATNLFEAALLEVV